MTPELEYIRTGILEDALADLHAVLTCIVVAVERKDRRLWGQCLDLARDYAGRAT